MKLKVTGWAMLAVGCFVVTASGAASAGAQKVVWVSNKSGSMQNDAVVDVPVATPAANWSARVGKAVVPAQYMPDTHSVRFVVSLKAHENVTVTLLPQAAPPSPKRVQVTLNVQEGGTLHGDATDGGAISGGTFHLHNSYTVPKDHFLHDGLLGFEGIGWESDRVAYRLYMDQRNVTDLFGKFTTDMIFRKVGLGFDDYQYPRSWGGDIFKVGPSLGVGGIGLLRDGKATQIGPATITGRMVADGPVTAIAGVDADAIAGGAGAIHATYAISAGSTLTWVRAHADQVGLPLVTGLTVHTGDELIQSETRTGTEWDYVAVWGAQEHGADKVGTVVFYRHGDVVGPPAMDGQTVFVTFTSQSDAAYASAGRWEQENKDVQGYAPIKDLGGFKAWLETQRAELNTPSVVAAP